ncbi:MAG TPA: MmcQ/YjbR family DNA-binding protein [Bacteroidales bacterium]|jgi:predicted DNA-binding protein (MmcQ/YjbR family)|nr:MmcQ-like protein [Bacteroidota bacterium]HJN06417.1 MmcQ/YjbR family DNA-binding protein [Bacteroidales bacterium]|tara:strand:+ start:151 stop:498 length:348 start_codon:yes stop_codon:yes gene_type:complete
MNVEDIRMYCLEKKGVTESFPFDDTTLVFKVVGKMFALVNLDGNLRLNLKCDPEQAIILREHHDSVIPGYHMNKKHWNTILLDETIADRLLMEWIDDSYNLIVENLPKKLKQKLH